MSARLNILFIIGILILLLATVGCGKLQLQSVTIGDPPDTYYEPAPRNYTVHDLSTGEIKQYHQVDRHTVHDLSTGEIKQIRRIDSHTIQDLSTGTIKHCHGTGNTLFCN